MTIVLMIVHFSVRSVFLFLGILLLLRGTGKYREFEMRSLPWLGVYLIMATALGLSAPSMTKLLLDALFAVDGHSFDPLGTQPGPFVWTPGEFMMVWSLLQSTMTSLVTLVVGGLVVADVVFLLKKTGSDIDRTVWSRLLPMRDSSAAWGIVMLLLAFSAPTVGFAFWLYYG